MSRASQEILVAYSLGSCIGVALYDAKTRVGGLLHAMLPSSHMDRAKARLRPGLFVDTGLLALLERFRACGGEPRRAIVKIAGGAEAPASSALFRIGERNCVAIRRALWRHGLRLAAAWLGGKQPKTVQLCVGSGQVRIRSRGKEVDL